MNTVIYCRSKAFYIIWHIEINKKALKFILQIFKAEAE